MRGDDRRDPGRAAEGLAGGTLRVRRASRAVARVRCAMGGGLYSRDFLSAQNAFINRAWVNKDTMRKEYQALLSVRRPARSASHLASQRMGVPLPQRARQRRSASPSSRFVRRAGRREEAGDVLGRAAGGDRGAPLQPVLVPRAWAPTPASVANRRKPVLQPSPPLGQKTPVWLSGIGSEGSFAA